VNEEANLTVRRRTDAESDGHGRQQEDKARGSARRRRELRPPSSPLCVFLPLCSVVSLLFCVSAFRLSPVACAVLCVVGPLLSAGAAGRQRRGEAGPPLCCSQHEQTRMHSLCSSWWRAMV
jgi:hypothetical protein